KLSSAQPLEGHVPCMHCSFEPCQFRRIQYRVNLKALRRWSAERLQIEARADGGVDARFRYEGTTCSNLGYPLRFEYTIRLGPRELGYPILAQRCAPLDEGYKHMCSYGPELMHTITVDAPHLGQMLHEAVATPHAEMAAGCYCDADSRAHKWA